MEFALKDFGLICDLSTPFSSLQPLPFGMAMSILWLSHYCILEPPNLFGCRDSPLERNLASR